MLNLTFNYIWKPILGITCSKIIKLLNINEWLEFLEHIVEKLHMIAQFSLPPAHLYSLKLDPYSSPSTSTFTSILFTLTSSDMMCLLFYYIISGVYKTPDNILSIPYHVTMPGLWLLLVVSRVCISNCSSLSHRACYLCHPVLENV